MAHTSTITTTLNALLFQVWSVHLTNLSWLITQEFSCNSSFWSIPKGSVFSEKVVISCDELSLSFTGYCSFHNFITFWAFCQRPTGCIHASKLNDIREHPRALEHNLNHPFIRMISGTVLSLANLHAPDNAKEGFPAGKLMRGRAKEQVKKVRLAIQLELQHLNWPWDN